MRPEFGSGPLWDDDWDGHREICPSPESLGLSAGLVDQLNDWQAAYDSTLDQSYPPDSRFTSSAVEARWREQGQALLAQLQLELGDDVTVRLEFPGDGVS